MSFAENRLIAVVIVATGHRSEFGYDALGRRVMIRELDKVSSVLTETSNKKYLWDGVAIAEEWDTTGATVQKRFYSQGFVDGDGTLLYYTKDHLGSIRELTDSAQTVRARYEYDPYGRMSKIQGDRDTVFGYTGYLWHGQSGLNLAMYRAYDSNLGRWINRDPIKESGGLNLYLYVNNDPINYMDSLGLCQEKIDCMNKIINEHFDIVKKVMDQWQNAISRENTIYFVEIAALSVALAAAIITAIV